MVILFSAKVAEKHQQVLEGAYPKVQFHFCEGTLEASEYLNKATVYVTYGDDVDEELINQAPNLQWISVLSAGVERLPFELIKERGIRVTNSRGIHKVQMAEYTISMLLQVYRQEKYLMKNEQQNSWDKSLRMKEITGQTMVVLGTGAIGQEIARLAKAFRMKTIGVSRSGRAVEFFDETHTIANLKEVLPEADFLVSVLPSTSETKYLLTEEHFTFMKNSAVFLNIGRGDLVASETLLKAIKEGQLAHVVLDVFEEEPLPADHPFWQEEQVTITPHISGQSPNYMVRALAIFQDNLDKLISGDQDFINLIDPTRGY
ncbi:D-2-hydroxyacid dehydrogenase [Ornithinibacillus contaminans]|uniref:D-2-hydroxyacid dehydrogenase n=1 Tax=Ornithinibacillus contaminans TaxID=694055 RepID=UPI00064DC657|nr:D-2-hydroxyacid dehydrogenase [Ornithinibacillus contaminans]